VRHWLRLLACQFALHVVLPGCGGTLQQLCLLRYAEQLQRLVRGFWPGEGVELDVLQDLQHSAIHGTVDSSGLLQLIAPG
jgi:hypothetical protein